MQQRINMDITKKIADHLENIFKLKTFSSHLHGSFTVNYFELLQLFSKKN